MPIDIQSKVNEYRTRAAEAIVAGADATLDHVRAKHEQSAKVWTELAAAEEARLSDRAARLAAVVQD